MGVPVKICRHTQATPKLPRHLAMVDEFIDLLGHEGFE